MRRYMSPRLVMAPRWFLPPLEFCRGTKPSQAPNCAPFLNCLKSPTLATTAEAVTGPTPSNCPAWRACALSLRWAAIRSSHQARWPSSSCHCIKARCSASRAWAPSSLLASSITSGSARRSAAGCCGNTKPNSASRPRMRLMQAVRSSLKPSRRRWMHSMLCCSTLLTGTKCICGRLAASQIAAASLASFLPLLPCSR